MKKIFRHLHYDLGRHRISYVSNFSKTTCFKVPQMVVTAALQDHISSEQSFIS